MRIPAWRLVLTGGAIVLLAGLGIGFVAASSAGAPSTTTPQAASSAAPDASGSPDGRRDLKGFNGLRGFFRGHADRFGFARRLVHVTATVLDKDGNLITIQLDHGSITAIDSDSITLSEAGGTSVTVSTDDATVVRTGRDKGSLSDLEVGAEIVIQSRVDGGTTLAKHILELPASTDS
jgi:Domain of unknown function (DUF5666)